MGNSIIKELSIKKSWVFIESRLIKLFLFQDDEDRFYLSTVLTNNPKEEILYVEKKRENVLIIIVYHRETDQYGKHTLIKKNDGCVIWEYPLFETDSDFVEYTFYFLESLMLHKDFNVDNFNINTLVEFMTGQEPMGIVRL